MWIYNGLPFKEPKDYVAFVYCIHNLSNNRFYIGKKQFWSRRNKKKVESDWKGYTGSCIELNEDISKGAVIEKKILHLCKNKGAASYLELKEQVDRNVLLDDQYYNRFIGCKIHANHLNSLRTSSIT